MNDLKARWREAAIAEDKRQAEDILTMTPICSGMAATAMERGAFIANGLAAGMCPAEVALAFITTNDGGKP